MRLSKWHSSLLLAAAAGTASAGDLRLLTDSGKVLFGASSDTNLYRSAANSLKTDGSLEVAGNLVGTTATFTGDLFAGALTIGSSLLDEGRLQFLLEVAGATTVEWEDANVLVGAAIRAGPLSYYYQDGSASGDKLSWTVRLPLTGAYTVTLYYLEATNRGIVSLAVDGAAPFATCDTYENQPTTGAVVDVSNTCTTTNVALSNSAFLLTSTVTSKNPAGTGYYIIADKIVFHLVY
jgi:hypothetical protein